MDSNTELTAPATTPFFFPSSLQATAAKSWRIVESPMKTTRSWRKAHRAMLRPTRA